MVKYHTTKNPSQTGKLGEKLAKEILMKKPRARDFVTVRGRSKKAVVVGLVGELGGGKTTFLQGFAKGLGIKEKILSPTFVIMRKSKIPSPKSEYKDFYHVDCYRIQKTREILPLRLREILSRPENIVAIEWADKIKGILPGNSIAVKFSFIDEKTRRIIIKYP